MLNPGNSADPVTVDCPVEWCLGEKNKPCAHPNGWNGGDSIYHSARARLANETAHAAQGA